MVRIAVFGATGRMGGAVTRVVSASEGTTVVGACTEPGHADLGADVGELARCGTLGVAVTDDPARALEGADVAIDFTLPAATAGNLAACRTAGCGLVIGTTGLAPEQMRVLEQASIDIPIVYGRNMSIGVNVLTELVRQAAAYLGPDWEVEVTEAHHREKRDAPSGTALQLGEAVATARGQALDDVAVYGRAGTTDTRPREAIGFHALRAGSIVGEHELRFISDLESVQLAHVATDRDVFAAGAVRAARWVTGKPPGLYGMRDVLGFA